MKPSAGDVVMIVALILCAMGLSFYMGIAKGESNIVKCQEDEVLVPNSYPYHSNDDLRCIHIDDVRTEQRTVVITPN